MTSTQRTSSTTSLTNGYHTPNSPASYSEEHLDHHGHSDNYLASRQEYARILYEHTMKQMEKFAEAARTRGTLSMEHYPVQQTAAAGN
jgi:hypothetical protein